METRASYIVVGLFTLLVLLGGVIAVIWMAGVQLDEDVAQYDIFFKGSVTGLKEGNQVRYRGVPFGVVTAMRVDPENVEQVKVTIEVPSKPPIKTDAVASLEYQGITGIAYVQIAGGTQEAGMLKRKAGDKNPVIASKASQLDVVMEKAPELVTRFIALVDRANALLNPANQEKFALILNNVEGFTDVLFDSRSDIRALIQNGAETMGEARSAATEAKEAIAKIRTGSDRVTDDAVAAMRDTRALVTELRQSVDLLTGEASSTMGTVRGGVDEATVTLGEIRRLAADLRTSSLEFTEGMNEALQQMRGEMDGVGAEAQAAIRTMNRSAGHVGDAAEQLSGFIKDNREPVGDFAASGLYELTQLLSETRILVNALARISARLEQDPARFLFGDSQRGVEVK